MRKWYFKNFRITAPGTGVLLSLFLYCLDNFFAQKLIISQISDHFLSAAIFFLGAILGMVWSDLNRKGSWIRKLPSRMERPIELKPLIAISNNQTELQDGITRHFLFATLQNHSRKMQPGVRVKMHVTTGGNADYEEHVFETKKIDGYEDKDVRCIEFLTYDNNTPTQYRIHSSNHETAREWNTFSEPLNIFCCLATDKQPQFCEGTITVVCPNHAKNCRVVIEEQQGFVY